MENYTIESISFPSCDKVNTVSGQIYIPKTTPVGIIQISHGMCEYVGRYHRFMADMANKGYVVAGHDHIGHGDSSPVERYGYFGEKDGYKNLVEDLHQMTVLLKKRFPSLPCILFGHSMGSFITRVYLSSYSHELAGVIICGTGGPNPMAKMGRMIAGIVRSAKGSMHRSPTLDRMVFGSFNKKFTPSRTSKDWLTRNEKIVDIYLKDPKCMFLFTTAGFQDLTALSTIANSADWYQSLDPDLPMLLISGDMDPVGNYGKGVTKVYQNLKAAGIRNVSMELYPGARHELLNEINYEEVRSDITLWISQVLHL